VLNRSYIHYDDDDKVNVDHLIFRTDDRGIRVNIGVGSHELWMNHRQLIDLKNTILYAEKAITKEILDETS